LGQEKKISDPESFSAAGKGGRSSSIQKSNPMTPLVQKLNQLNLFTMSRQLETTLTEAAAKNLSAAATLE